MPPRKLVFAAPLCLLALLLVAACGGGDDDDSGPGGQLSDPNNVPTATPWVDLPDVVSIDPNNIQPLPPDGGGGEEATPTLAPGAPGDCGQTYTVEAGDTAFGIGEKCGWPADDLETFITELESLNPEQDVRALNIGDILIMPNLPAETPEDTSEATEEATP